MAKSKQRQEIWFGKVYPILKIYSTQLQRSIHRKEGKCSFLNIQSWSSSRHKMAQIILPSFKFPDEVLWLKFQTKSEWPVVIDHLLESGWELVWPRSWFEPWVSSYFRPRAGDHWHPEQGTFANLVELVISRNLPFLWAPRLKPPPVQVSDYFSVANNLVVPRTTCWGRRVNMIMVMSKIFIDDKSYRYKQEWTRHPWWACTATCHRGRASPSWTFSGTWW